MTIAGVAGVGKTTIAHRCFPKPIFIPIENGLLSVQDADAFQRPNNTGEILYFLEAARQARLAGTFAFETVILDSVSELETMAVREVCAQHGVAAIGDVKGFGTGYGQVGDIHRTIREKCEELLNAGLHVVAISHAVSVEEKLPDSEPYSTYALQIGKKGSAQWLNQVDCCIHVKASASIKEVGAAKHKISKAIKNQRILDMVSKPSTMAKNRFGVNQEITFTFTPDGGHFNNPLAPILGFAGFEQRAQEQPARVAEPDQAAEPAPMKSVEPTAPQPAA